VICALVIALLLVSTAVAAADEGAPDGQSPRPPREEIYRMVDTYLADHLQENLGLSDEQLHRVLPLVRKLNTDRRRLAERRIRALHEMRRMMKAGKANDPRIAELLQQVRTAEAEEPVAVRMGHDAIDAVLTPVQQAQYRVLESEVEHRMRRVMGRVRAERRDGQGRPQRPDAPRPSPDVP